jgi:hypothetical protein
MLAQCLRFTEPCISLENTIYRGCWFTSETMADNQPVKKEDQAQQTRSGAESDRAVGSLMAVDGLADEAQPQPEGQGPADGMYGQDGQDGESIPTSTNSSVGLSVSRLGIPSDQTMADKSKVDTDDSDTESALGDMSIASSSVSATSSVFKFVEKYGRTFHSYKEGSELPTVPRK